MEIFIVHSTSRAHIDRRQAVSLQWPSSSRLFREKSLAPDPKIKTHYLTWMLVRKRLLKMFSVGNWERHPEIPMLWKWKRTSEHLGICVVCLLRSEPSGKWVWKWVCREQHLHTSITNGGWSPHKTFSHRCSSSTGLRWAPTPIICRAHILPSAWLSTSQIISSSLSAHRLMYMRTGSQSRHTHTPIKPLIHLFHWVNHTVQGHFITTNLLPEFISFPLKGLLPLYGCFDCC